MTTTQPPAKPDETPIPVLESEAAQAAPPPAPAPAPEPAPGKGSRRGAIVVIVLILLSLLWHFIADRLTPYTSQARIQAFVGRKRGR